MNCLISKALIYHRSQKAKRITLKYLAVFSCLFFLISISSTSHARPRKGFHSGPYLALEIGTMQADYDLDQVTATHNGNKYEPCFGFLFGWNVYDFLSAEIQGRYATNFNGGQREHLAGGALFAKYTFITDALTDFDTFRVLPFIKLGVASRISGLPSNSGAGGGTVVSWGVGPSPGLGIAFVWQKYFYFGVDIQEDLLFLNDINQTVNGVPGTLVYKGGFHPCFGAMAILGVHY